MARCLLGLGSNLGDRQAMLRRATGRVANLDGCRLVARSRWCETAPIGGPTGQGAFLNGALLIDCTISPHELAGALQAVESQLGRDRAIRWDARAIDIDLLLFGSEVVETVDLMVPHPRMSFRKFVLEPAAEIAGFMVDPVSGWTLSGLLSHLESAARYVAVTSADAEIAAWLAERLCQNLGCLRLEEVCETVVSGLSKSFWLQDQELLKRLPSGSEGSQLAVPPVVSAFWQETTRQVPMKRGKPLEDEPTFPIDILSPALVIALEPGSEKKFQKKNSIKKIQKESQLPQSSYPVWRDRAERKGHGPMARIQADDPAIVLQEAIAAVRSIWPELTVKHTEELS